MSDIFYKDKDNQLPLFMRKYNLIEQGKDMEKFAQGAKIGTSKYYKTENSIYTPNKRLISSIFDHTEQTYVF